MKFKRVDEIGAWRLCMGCGACVAQCEGGALNLVDMPELGMRPNASNDVRAIMGKLSYAKVLHR